MASHPVDPAPPPEWQSSAQTDNRSQLIACLRAGIISLVLLIVLAVVVLF